LIWFIWLVSFNQKPDRPDRPNEQDRLANCFSILLEIRQADLEKLRSLGTIAADLADGYMPVGMAGYGHSRT
jgi:hypothetical protein